MLMRNFCLANSRLLSLSNRRIRRVYRIQWYWYWAWIFTPFRGWNMLVSLFSCIVSCHKDHSSLFVIDMQSKSSNLFVILQSFICKLTQVFKEIHRRKQSVVYWRYNWCATWWWDFYERVMDMSKWFSQLWKLAWPSRHPLK